MKIALVGPLDSAVSLNAVGGTEVWTAQLAESLVANGHDVTLFATAESKTAAKLAPTCKARDVIGAQTGKVLPQKFAIQVTRQMLQVVERQNEFDCIHLSVYSLHYYLPLTELIKKPVIVTLHGSSIPKSDMAEIFQLYPKPHYVFISKNFAERWPKPQRGRVIYNGVPVERFFVSNETEDYFFWIGRINPDKGLADAVTACQKNNRKLVIAGPIQDQQYFDEQIKPRLSNAITYVGPLSFEQKHSYYCYAKALLMPIHWDEPFGLVVVEAMACGTPVVAYARGSLPELIVDGNCGYLAPADDLTAFEQKIALLETLDQTQYQAMRHAARQRAEQFTIEKMVQSYLAAYTEITK